MVQDKGGPIILLVKATAVLTWRERLGTWQVKFCKCGDQLHRIHVHKNGIARN